MLVEVLEQTLRVMPTALSGKVMVLRDHIHVGIVALKGFFKICAMLQLTEPQLHLVTNRQNIPEGNVNQVNNKACYHKLLADCMYDQRPLTIQRSLI